MMTVVMVSSLSSGSEDNICNDEEQTKQRDLLSFSIQEIISVICSLPDALFPRRRLYLPKVQKTLVLDLDETLVHSTSKSSRNYDAMIEVLIGKSSCLYYVFKRPHVDYFLKKISEWYRIVIFTASLPEYADPVIDWLDSTTVLLQKRLFRQSCIMRSGAYLKDLSIIEPNLAHIALIDNAAASFIINPVDSWYGDRKDEALLDLLPFLDALRFVDDFRSVLSLRRFQNKTI